MYNFSYPFFFSPSVGVLPSWVAVWGVTLSDIGVLWITWTAFLPGLSEVLARCHQLLHSYWSPQCLPSVVVLEWKTRVTSRNSKRLRCLLCLFGFVSDVALEPWQKKLILTAPMLLADLFYLVVFRLLHSVVFLWLSFFQSQVLICLLFMGTHGFLCFKDMS